jgi:excisionase family DNA binding protein
MPTSSLTSPPYLTPAQAAQELQVARKTVYDWIKRGWVRAGKLPGGTELRIRRSDWTEFVETLFAEDEPGDGAVDTAPSPPPPVPAAKRRTGPIDFFALGAASE